MSTSLKKMRTAKEFLTALDVHLSDGPDLESQIMQRKIIALEEIIQLLVINEDATKPSEYLDVLTKQLGQKL